MCIPEVSETAREPLQVMRSNVEILRPLLRSPGTTVQYHTADLNFRKQVGCMADTGQP
jgi:hypothetical protein